MAGLPPFLMAKGNQPPGAGNGSVPPPGGNSGGSSSGSVPPQFAKGKTTKGKNSQGRQGAIARRMAAMRK